MSGFRFPPPPPPPPTDTSWQQVGPNHHSGSGSGSGSGEQRGRGRGRGGSRGGRGRNGHALSNIPREALASIRNATNDASNQSTQSTSVTPQPGQGSYNGYNSYTNQLYGSYHQASQHAGAQSPNAQTYYGLPNAVQSPAQHIANAWTGGSVHGTTHFNPAFQHGIHPYATNYSGQATPSHSYQSNQNPIHPPHQTGYGRDNHNNGYHGQGRPDSSSSNHAGFQGGLGSCQRGAPSYKGPLNVGPPKTHDGHKRKSDAIRGRRPRKFQKTGPPAAPSVPGFGLPVNQSKSQLYFPAEKDSNQIRKVSPPNRTLGLTPGDAEPVYSSSESDSEGEDVDEEKLYKALGQGLTFEHNGCIMTLNNIADLTEWISERKENFPTKARLPEKEEKKRRVGNQRNRLLAEAKEALRDRLSPKKKIREKPSKTVHRRESTLERERHEVAQLRSQLTEKERRLSRLEAKVEDPTEACLDDDGDEERAVEVNGYSDTANTEGKSMAGPPSISNPPRGNSAPEVLSAQNGFEVRTELVEVGWLAITHDADHLETEEEDTRDVAFSDGNDEGTTAEIVEHDEAVTTKCDPVAVSVSTNGNGTDACATKEAQVELEGPAEEARPRELVVVQIDETAQESFGRGEHAISIASLKRNDEPQTALSSSDRSGSDSSSKTSDDEAPDTMSARKPPLATTKKKLCRFFSSTGRCRDGDTCGFRHELKPQAAVFLKKEAAAKEERRRDPYAPVLDEPKKSAKKSLHQRLLEQEQDCEENMALQVIKYLGKEGVFGQEHEAQS